MNPLTTTRHTIRLKDGALRSAMNACGIELMSTLQRRTGLSRSQLDHVETGRKQPGPYFVGSLLAALPKRGFDDLFEVVPAADPAHGSAGS